MFNPGKIIWSADVSLSELSAVVNSGVLPEGLIIKLDQQWIIANLIVAPLRSGKKAKDLTLDDLAIMLDSYHLIGAIQDKYRIFLDWKMSEIPTKVEGITKEFGYLTPLFMLNCMAGITSTGLWKHEDKQKIDGLKRFADSCHTLGIHPTAVTVLTSKTGETCQGEFGKEAQEQVKYYAGLLSKAGFTDLVCSPQEAEFIRSHSEFGGLHLNCPGIRLPDTNHRDQSRVMTPVKALEFVNRLVIGSNITDGTNPDIIERVRANIQRLKDHIEGG